MRGVRLPEIAVLGTYADVPGADWDALVGDGSPFLEHAFLEGLERFGCAVPQTGWGPRPVIVRDEGRIVAGAPGWVKGHSMGEFVYDHAWANAAERAGIPYYPKLVAAVPFTPVTGRRLLTLPGEDTVTRQKQLLYGLSEASRSCRGLHLLFNDADESALCEEAGLFQRIQFQFHWSNQGYGCFEDWLAAAFTSKQRNKVRRERKAVAEKLQIEVITAPGPDVLDALHGFYANTCQQFGPWGRVYLSRAFFQYLGEIWADRLHAVIARDGERIVAGAFNVLKGDRLYGRYWGCDDEVDFLHFEVCYYAPIAWCIERGVGVFEPGHGGGHKYRRGFKPVITYSNHRLHHSGLHEALRDHAAQEAVAVEAEADFLYDRRK